MTIQSGLSTTVPNDVRSLVLHSITKQAGRSRDRLDHRSMVEIRRHLIHWSIEEIRDALAELQDENLISRETSNRGEGWMVVPSRVDNLGISSGFRKSEDVDLTIALGRCEAAHQGSGTRGVQVGHQTDRNSEEEKVIRPSRSFSYSSLAGANLRTVSDVPARIVRGRYIDRAKSSRIHDPDSPFGLSVYFKQSMEEAGLPWGECNHRALSGYFKEGLDSGYSPGEVRRIIDTFFHQPERLHNLGKPVWVQFLAERKKVQKQAGVSNRKVVAEPEGREWTEEDYEEARRRSLAKIYGQG